MDKKGCIEVTITYYHWPVTYRDLLLILQNNRQQSPEHTQNEISSRSFGQNVCETPTGDIVQILNLSPDTKQQGGNGRTQSKRSDAGHPDAGLKTSDFYKVRDNVPERFNHPGMHTSSFV